MVAMSVLPESPIWLTWKGRSTEASYASRRLVGNDAAGVEAEADAENESETEGLVSAFSNEVSSIFSPHLDPKMA